MSTLQIDLPDSLKDFVESRAAASGYPSAGDYVTALLRGVQKRQAWDELEPLVLEGLASPAREMAPRDWQQLREVIDQIEARQGQP